MLPLPWEYSSRERLLVLIFLYSFINPSPLTSSVISCLCRTGSWPGLKSEYPAQDGPESIIIDSNARQMPKKPLMNQST